MIQISIVSYDRFTNRLEADARSFYTTSQTTNASLLEDDVEQATRRICCDAISNLPVGVSMQRYAVSMQINDS